VTGFPSLSITETIEKLKSFGPDILGFMMTTYMFQDTLFWIKEIKKAKTFDEVVRDLVLKELGVEPEMFGVDKGKIKPYTPGDRMEDRL